MQKILVIQTAFIGDVVLATALVEKLHVHYPQAQSIFCCVREMKACWKDIPSSARFGYG